MTGEVTLRGRVMPIGGLREKTMAAYRAGIRTIIIPKDNEPDLDEVEQVVKDHVTFVPAAHMDTVIETTIDFSRRPSSTPHKCSDTPEAKIPMPTPSSRVPSLRQ